MGTAWDFPHDILQARITSKTLRGASYTLRDECRGWRLPSSQLWHSTRPGRFGARGSVGDFSAPRQLAASPAASPSLIFPLIRRSNARRSVGWRWWGTFSSHLLYGTNFNESPFNAEASA